MRGLFVVALVLAAPLAMPAAEAGLRCDFHSAWQFILPGTSYYVNVSRSRCEEHGVTVHKETTLVTQGNPNDPFHVVVARAEMISVRQGGASGPGTTTDSVIVQHGSSTSTTMYRTDKSGAGFTTCNASTDLRLETWFAFRQGQPLAACAPYEFAML